MLAGQLAYKISIKENFLFVNSFDRKFYIIL
nr:MAG TPA: hypothetical protein [Caudoviricetes sp.]